MYPKLTLAARLANYLRRPTPGLQIAVFMAGVGGTIFVCEYVTDIIDEEQRKRKVSERPPQYNRLDDKVNKLMDKVSKLEKRPLQYKLLDHKVNTLMEEVTQLEKKLEKNLEKKN